MGFNFVRKDYFTIEKWKNNYRFWKNFKKKLLYNINFFKFVTIVILGILLVYELNFILQQSYLLKIKDIKISPLQNVSPLWVINTLELNLGDSIWQAKKNIALHRQKLLSNPWIKNFSYQILTNNILQINIQERKPAYIAVATNGERFILSKDGFILCREKEFKGKVPHKIIISGIFPAVEKARKDVPKVRLKTALRWIAFLHKEGFNNISEINLSDEYNFFFRLKNGIKIYVSSLKELQAKKKLLQKTLQKIATENLLVEYIDLRTNGGLIFKPY